MLIKHVCPAFGGQTKRSLATPSGSLNRRGFDIREILNYYLFIVNSVQDEISLHYALILLICSFSPRQTLSLRYSCYIVTLYVTFCVEVRTSRTGTAPEASNAG